VPVAACSLPVALVALVVLAGAVPAVAQEPPVIQLAFYEVFAAPGDEVTFDASLSLDPGGGDLTFAWDLDGDGQDDLTGPEPVVTHTYGEPFEGTAIVRATTAAGGEATAEVAVLIASEEEITGRFAPPEPPADVSVRRSGTGSAELTWAPSPSAGIAGYVVNDAESGTRVGIAGPEETSLAIEGLPRSAVRISIRAQNELGRASEPAEVALPAAGEDGGGGSRSPLWTAAAIAAAAAAVLVIAVRRRRPAHSPLTPRTRRARLRLR
jgi:hypothetical protein